MTMNPRARLLAAILAIIMVSAPQVAADLIPFGYRSVDVESRLFLGPIADHAYRLHRVEKGDTLQAVAGRYLDSGIAAQNKIFLLNPRIDPMNLKVGTELLIPPVKEHRLANGRLVTSGYHVFWIRPGFSRELPTRVAHGAVLATPKWGFRIAIVPNEDLEKFMSSWGQKAEKNNLKTWISEFRKVSPGTAFSPSLRAQKLVRESSATQRMNHRFTLKDLKGNEAKFQVTTERFDGGGKRVVAGMGRFGFLPPLVSCVAAMGMGLVLFRRRRKREQGA